MAGERSSTHRVHVVRGYRDGPLLHDGADVYCRDGRIFVKPATLSAASFDAAGAENLIEALRAALADLRAASVPQRGLPAASGVPSC